MAGSKGTDPEEFAAKTADRVSKAEQLGLGGDSLRSTLLVAIVPDAWTSRAFLRENCVEVDPRSPAIAKNGALGYQSVVAGSESDAAIFLANGFKLLAMKYLVVTTIVAPSLRHLPPLPGPRAMLRPVGTEVPAGGPVQRVESLVRFMKKRGKGTFTVSDWKGNDRAMPVGGSLPVIATGRLRPVRPQMDPDILTEEKVLQLANIGIERGIDPRYLTAIARVESNFNTRAQSPAGALGLMQIMPATGKEYGCNRAELFDPGLALSCASRYITYLRRRTVTLDLESEAHGVTAVTAAYNMGPGRLKKGWELSDSPLETRNYVPVVIRTYNTIRNEHPDDSLDQLWPMLANLKALPRASTPDLIDQP